MIAPSLGFPFALNVIDRPAAADRKVTQIPRGFLSVPGVEFYAGVAYSPDGKLLYVATGDSGAVDVMSTAGLAKDRADQPEWRVAEPSLQGELRCSARAFKQWPQVVRDRPGELAGGGDRYRDQDEDRYPHNRCQSDRAVPESRWQDAFISRTRDYSSTRQFPAQTTPTGCTVGSHFPPFGYPSAAAQDGTTSKAGRFQAWAMPTMRGEVRCGPTTLATWSERAM